MTLSEQELENLIVIQGCGTYWVKVEGIKPLLPRVNAVYVQFSKPVKDYRPLIESRRFSHVDRHFESSSSFGAQVVDERLGTIMGVSATPTWMGITVLHTSRLKRKSIVDYFFMVKDRLNDPDAEMTLWGEHAFSEQEA